MPLDLTVRVGSTARLQCAATGSPTPQVAWQKDGGFDFPAARERRMHVMPDDDVFFIVDVKLKDAGVYSCTASNDAGVVQANATLAVIRMCHPHCTRLLAASIHCLSNCLPLDAISEILTLLFTSTLQVFLQLMHCII